MWTSRNSQDQQTVTTTTSNHRPEGEAPRRSAPRMALACGAPEPLCQTARERGFHEPGFLHFSAQLFVGGFVVSANLRNSCWSFYRGEIYSLCKAPQFSAKLPQQMRRIISNAGSRNSLRQTGGQEEAKMSPRGAQLGQWHGWLGRNIFGLVVTPAFLHEIPSPSDAPGVTFEKGCDWADANSRTMSRAKRPML